ncbi:MAG: hypothetical protein NC337_09340 [Roseburia sp.]|nr:hypothetical protein [Roseburia sp.]
MYKQMDLYSFMQSMKEEPPILLSGGQTVYLVEKAEIIKCTVSDERSWMCGEYDRGYRLIRESLYDVTWNSRIGKEAFTDYADAKSKADEYLENHSDVIFAKDMLPRSTVAYSCKSDNRELVAFCCDLGSDMYYIKEFTTYHHIGRGNEAAKNFMRQQEFRREDVKRIEGYVPVLKNMYRCSKQSDWEYAESSYKYAVG